MSKAIKSVASIALPIALSFVAPGIGTALGSTLTAGTLGTIGGAVGGAISGGVINKGGLRGALLGGLSGAASAGLTNAAIGTAAQAAPAAGTAAAAGAKALGVSGASAGSGILGAITGGGSQAVNAGFQAVADTVTNPASALLTAGNQVFAQGAADDAKKAAQIQAGAIDRATATQQPYNQLGTTAANQIQQIQSDPGAYVQNNPFYKSLADDAQRRLMASEASKGKVGSGGTANELQTQLLNLGNGLVQQQVGTLQNQVNSGQTAATNTSNLQTSKGDVQAAGVVGAGNALSTGYQNQINTLLALNNTPSYQPSQTIRR